jgi:hypothetical protein
MQTELPNEVVMAEKRGESLVKDFLESQRVDRMADYLRRGRKYRPLTDDDLIAKWLASVKAMADAPGDPSCHVENDDAEAELALRKIDPPYEAAEPDFDRYMEVSEAAIRGIKADPKKLKDLKAGLVEDLRAFQDERDRSH